MEALGGRVPAGQVQDSRSLFRQGRASLASTGGPKRLALLEVTTCTATSGLGHASSAKPWRACSRQVRDSGLTTRTRPSSAQACSEKGLTLHLLDVVPENDIRKARPAQSVGVRMQRGVCVQAGEEERAWWDDWEQERERGGTKER